MPPVYVVSPLRFKSPESNGGFLTENDMFSGINYYTDPLDLIENGIYSSSLSNVFNIYSSFNSPRLARYIPSPESFSSRFYKGIYIYNPSIENDGVLYECARRNIIFSVNGGNSILLEEPIDEKTVFYENNKYLKDLNDNVNFYKVNTTSSNGNVKIFLSGMDEKNRNLPYFGLDGSGGRESVEGRRYVEANSGIIIPELFPGEYYGIFLRVDSQFDIDSKPFDYSFFNLTYENFPVEEGETFLFGDRDVIPGFSTGENRYYMQSLSIKFNTSLSSIRRNIDRTINLIYDNYPPFFSDYREVD